MIVFGESLVLYKTDPRYKFDVFNLMSFSTEGIDIRNIIPRKFDISYFKNAEFSNEFDSLYQDYIFNNDSVFVSFFSIIYAAYLGHNVYIMIGNMAYSTDTVVESLIKIIRARYGLESYIINDESDINDQNESNFSVEGLKFLDYDKQRFSSIRKSFGLKVVEEDGAME